MTCGVLFYGVVAQMARALVMVKCERTLAAEECAEGLTNIPTNSRDKNQRSMVRIRLTRTLTLSYRFDRAA